MLQIMNLRAGYDGHEKLHGICARIEPGSITTIVGPNGCGKSTLLKCAAGLLKPADGEIILNGQPVGRMNDKERARHIAYMPQSRIVPDISVRQLAVHGRYPHLKWGQALSENDRSIVQKAMERAGIAALAEKNIAQLSGGERQLAYLAMMLAQQTPVMLLDEPTTHLDLAGQFALMDMLRKLADDGRCVAVVLHDLALALEYADSILLMADGKARMQASPEAIFTSGEMQKIFGVDIQKTPEGKFIFYSARQEGFR